MPVSIAILWPRQKDGSKLEACLRENVRPFQKKEKKKREENVIIDNRQSISFL